MRKVIVVFVLLVFSAACDPFYDVEVPVVGSNPTPYEIGITINGVEAGPIIAPYSSVSFMTVVRVPNPPNDPTAPLDLITSVSVTVHNFTLGRQTETRMCQAGGKIYTTVEYTVSEGENYFRERVDCWRSYSY